MKLIIAGSRNIILPSVVSDAFRAVTQIITPTEIVSGAARGVDTMGENIAFIQGIPVKSFPADWDKYGKRAGYLRNREMGLYADVLLAVWDGSSRGTKMMIDIMQELKKPVFIHFA